MTAQTKVILDAALALSESERVQLAEHLLETVPSDGDAYTDEELLAELERRAAEYEENPSIGISLSEVLKRE